MTRSASDHLFNGTLEFHGNSADGKMRVLVCDFTGAIQVIEDFSFIISADAFRVEIKMAPHNTIQRRQRRGSDMY